MGIIEFQAPVFEVLRRAEKEFDDPTSVRLLLGEVTPSIDKLYVLGSVGEQCLPITKIVFSLKRSMMSHQQEFLFLRCYVLSKVDSYQPQIH